jgi:hypothetical protein
MPVVGVAADTMGHNVLVVLEALGVVETALQQRQV